MFGLAVDESQCSIERVATLLDAALASHESQRAVQLASYLIHVEGGLGRAEISQARPRKFVYIHIGTSMETPSAFEDQNTANKLGNQLQDCDTQSYAKYWKI